MHHEIHQQRRVVFGPYVCPEDPEREGWFAVPGHGLRPLNDVYGFAARLGLLSQARCETVDVAYKAEL